MAESATVAAPEAGTFKFQPAFLQIPVKDVDTKERTIEGWASTKNPDLSGDVWDPRAWKKSMFRWKKRGTRPKFVGYHEHSLLTGHSPVLGKLLNVKVNDVGAYFKAWFAETELGEEHLYLYDKEAMDYFSAGYLTLEAIYHGDRDEKGKDIFAKHLKRLGIDEELQAKARRILLDTEVFEISCVVVGMNLEALAKAMGASDSKTAEYASRAMERLQLAAGIDMDMTFKAVPADETKGATEVFDFESPAYDHLDIRSIRDMAKDQVNEVEELGEPTEDETEHEVTTTDPLEELKSAEDGADDTEDGQADVSAIAEELKALKEEISSLRAELKEVRGLAESKPAAPADESEDASPADPGDGALADLAKAIQRLNETLETKGDGEGESEADAGDSGATAQTEEATADATSEDPYQVLTEQLQDQLDAAEATETADENETENEDTQQEDS